MCRLNVVLFCCSQVRLQTVYSRVIQRNCVPFHVREKHILCGCTRIFWAVKSCLPLTEKGTQIYVNNLASRWVLWLCWRCGVVDCCCCRRQHYRLGDRDDPQNNKQIHNKITLTCTITTYFMSPIYMQIPFNSSKCVIRLLV